MTTYIAGSRKKGTPIGIEGGGGSVHPNPSKEKWDFSNRNHYKIAFRYTIQEIGGPIPL
jgi:hypothetical protein